MSTRVGTLQGTSVGRSIWPAAVLRVARHAGDRGDRHPIDRDEGRPGAQTFVGRQVVNTPSELSGTSAGSSSIAIVTPAMQAAIVASRNAADAPSSEPSGGSTGNTPSELTGGMFDRYGLHQRI